MTLQITSVNMRYQNEVVQNVDVRFSAQGEGTNVSGSLQLTAEEYAGNEAVDALEVIVKNKLIAQLSA